MTESELKEIEGRLEKANGGKFHCYREEDFDFIAHALEDIRKLLDEVRRLREENEHLNDKIWELTGEGDWGEPEEL